mmetsp:Transcript_6377/g.14163  ORF Transcript_6377/g.14163 Transcript_6377/m.14163 type:complete len:209 (+) Transcript_6377:204-830(+)
MTEDITFITLRTTWSEIDTQASNMHTGVRLSCTLPLWITLVAHSRLPAHIHMTAVPCGHATSAPAWSSSDLQAIAVGVHSVHVVQLKQLLHQRLAAAERLLIHVDRSVGPVHQLALLLVDLEAQCLQLGLSSSKVLHSSEHLEAAARLPALVLRPRPHVVRPRLHGCFKHRVLCGVLHQDGPGAREVEHDGAGLSHLAARLGDCRLDL